METYYGMSLQKTGFFQGKKPIFQKRERMKAIVSTPGSLPFIVRSFKAAVSTGINRCLPKVPRYYNSDITIISSVIK